MHENKGRSLGRVGHVEIINKIRDQSSNGSFKQHDQNQVFQHVRKRGKGNNIY